jgi:hypothetical protein
MVDNNSLKLKPWNRLPAAKGKGAVAGMKPAIGCITYQPVEFEKREA